MSNLSSEELLESFSDRDVFEESARRLKRRFRENYGINLRFGSFEFIFEEGVFEGIDHCVTNFFYQSPKHLRIVPRE